MCSSLEICHTGCLICTSDENTLTQCNTLQHTQDASSARLTTLQHTHTMQHTATNTGSLFCTSSQDRIAYPHVSLSATHRNTPQRTVTLSHTAVHCNTLQHTPPDAHATGCLIFARLFPQLRYWLLTRAQLIATRYDILQHT